MDEPTPDRRHWPRLILTLPPQAAEDLGMLARVNFRDRKREALRLLMDGLDREATAARKAAMR